MLRMAPDTRATATGCDGTSTDPRLELRERTRLQRFFTSATWTAIRFGVRASVAPSLLLGIAMTDRIIAFESSLLYLSAIMACVSCPIKPRAAFVQQMLVTVFAVCIGSLLSMMALCCCVAARNSATDRSVVARLQQEGRQAQLADLYQPSAAGVAALFLFIYAWLGNMLKSMFFSQIMPLNLATIITSVPLLTFYNTTSYHSAIHTCVRVLRVALFGFSITLGAGVLVFPYNSRESFLTCVGKTITTMQDMLIVSRQLGIDLRNEVVGVTDYESHNAHVMRMKQLTAAVFELVGMVKSSRQSASLEIAYGHLSAHQLTELERLVGALALHASHLTQLSRMNVLLLRAAHDANHGSHARTASEENDILAQGGDEGLFHAMGHIFSAQDRPDLLKKLVNEILIPLLRPLNDSSFSALEECLCGLHIGHYKRVPFYVRPFVPRLPQWDAEHADHVLNSIDQQIETLDSQRVLIMEKWSTILRDYCSEGENEDAGNLPLKNVGASLAAFYVAGIYTLAKDARELLHFTVEKHKQGIMVKPRVVLPTLHGLKKAIQRAYISMLVTHREGARESDTVTDIQASDPTVIAADEDISTDGDTEPDDSDFMSVSTRQQNQQQEQQQQQQQKEDKKRKTIPREALEELQGLRPAQPRPEFEPRTSAIARYVAKPLQAIFDFLWSSVSGFGLRCAVAMLAASLPAYFRSTYGPVFLKYRFLWMTFSVLLGIQPIAGRSVFASVLRTIGTVVGGVAGLVAVEVGRVPAGYIPVAFLLLIPQFTVAQLRPQVGFLTILLSSITMVLVVGFDVGQQKLGDTAFNVPTGAMPMSPPVAMGFRILLTVAGVVISLFFTVCPPLPTSRSILRQDMSRCMYVMLDLLMHQSSRAIGMSHMLSQTGKVDGDPCFAANEATSRALQTRLLMMTAMAKPSLVFAKLEPSLRGKYPHEKWAELLDSVELLVGSVLVWSEAIGKILAAGSSTTPMGADLIRQSFARNKRLIRNLSITLDAYGSSLGQWRPLAAHLQSLSAIHLETSRDLISSLVTKYGHKLSDNFTSSRDVARFRYLVLATALFIDSLETVGRRIAALTGEHSYLRYHEQLHKAD